MYIYLYIKLLKLINGRSKVPEKNMSRERTLNFDQWQAFSKNYKPTRVWLWFTILLRIIVARNFFQVHGNSKDVSYLTWQIKYSNLNTTCHIKPRLFFRNEFLENQFIFHSELLSIYPKGTFASLGKFGRDWLCMDTFNQKLKSQMLHFHDEHHHAKIKDI